MDYSRPGLTELSVGLVSAQLATLTNIVVRAVVIMFVAAVITKRFDVFAAIGYVEALAWSAGYDLLKTLMPGQKKA